jgi:uncharacterized protein (DUF433 family)
MELPDFLTRNPDGEIHLTGHRIGLFHIVDCYNEGESAEMVASRYPTVPLSLVHKVIAFYLDHETEVNAYIAICQTTMDERQQGARRLDLDALRDRLSAGQQTASAK